LYGAIPSVPVDFFAPAHQGSVFRAVTEGYRVIGIVDGLFGNVPSIWHKEILYALSEGAAVFGAASMGALRAAELSSLGMIGIGLAYRLFRRGVLKDDDEVCVIHAPADSGFRPLSIAMLDFRLTLRAISRVSVERNICDEVLDALKRLHFSERTLYSARKIAIDRLGDREGAALADSIERNLLSSKREDAMRMISALLTVRTDNNRKLFWRFPETQHFTRQFRRELLHVPKNEPYSQC